MECTIRTIRRTHKLCYYHIPEYSEWEITAKRIHGLGRAEFKVFQNDKLEYELKQPNLLLPCIVKFPLLMPFFESPFYFYQDGVKCGRWKTFRNPCFRPGIWEFYFEDATYRLELGPYYSLRQLLRSDPWIPRDTLYRNGARVAVYTRRIENSVHSVRACYDVEYDAEMAKRPDILLLFGSFIENYLQRDIFPSTYD